VVYFFTKNSRDTGLPVVIAILYAKKWDVTNLIALDVYNGDFRRNIMGMAIETAKILSVVIFYLRFAKQEKVPVLQFVKP